jgi:enoyl-CoA hydratase/carnithine racemase
MDLKTTRWEVEDEIATLTLSRPQRHNAWTGRMHTELRHLLQRAEADSAVRVVVITGDPEGRAFCPGADSQALEGHVARGAYDAGTPDDIANPGYGIRPEFDADFAYFLGLETVTIAAVNGATAGAGLALACWCDLRFVASDAKLTAAHGRLNLPAEYGMSWLLPRIIGHGRASDLLLSSRTFTGEEAHAMGLAVAAIPTDRVVDEALAYARRLVSEISPGALEATKRQLAVDAVRLDPRESVRDAQHRLDVMTTEPDYREAITAFTERRPPRWDRTPT